MTELTDLLQHPKLVEETHAFLWTDPFENRGMVDAGWSCRDHAVVLGSLVLRCGGNVELRHGRCMFVLGPTDDGKPPVGVGQDSDGSDLRHTWLYVQGVGDVDISPKLALREGRWRPVRGPGVIGSTWIGDRPTEFIYLPAPGGYENAIARATHAQDAARAIYCGIKQEPFTFDRGCRGLSWANSRVSLRLLQRNHPDDLYVRFAAHLEGVVAGSRRSLRRLSTNKAWHAIANDPTLEPNVRAG